MKSARSTGEILTTNKNFLSSPLSTFFYEMSFYLDIPVSRIKSDYGGECQYLFRLRRKVYRRKKFRRKCKKKRCGKYKTGGTLRRLWVYLKQYIEQYSHYCRLTFEFILYETFVLLVDISLRKRQKTFLRKKLKNCNGIVAYFERTRKVCRMERLGSNINS